MDLERRRVLVDDGMCCAFSFSRAFLFCVNRRFRQMIAPRNTLLPAFRAARLLIKFASITSAVIALYGSASAQLTITPTFDPSVTDLTNASAIEAGIYAAITQIENSITTRFSDPVTIYFTNSTDPNVLGQSLTPQEELSYTTYLSDLGANPTLSPLQTAALSTMPVTPGSDLNNDTNLFLTAANLAAIGETNAAEALVSSEGGGYNSTLTFNFASLNPSRTGGQVIGNYDEQSVIFHEVDEVLGIGGTGSELSWDGTGLVPALPSELGPLDFFRYSTNGVRSFAYGTNTVAYFSIDRGATKLVSFNQNPGGDFADWSDGVIPSDGSGNTPEQVQDAFGTPWNGANYNGYAAANLGVNELTAFQVVGYSLVPEPSTYALLGLGALVMVITARRRVR
jgi:hypothetical protein